VPHKKKLAARRFLHIPAGAAWRARPERSIRTAATGSVDEISRKNQARLEVPVAGACDIQMTSFSPGLS
jgi:hypothetical protein